jgi:hypothetical protein
MLADAARHHLGTSQGDSASMPAVENINGQAIAPMKHKDKRDPKS